MADDTQQTTTPTTKSEEPTAPAPAAAAAPEEEETVVFVSNISPSATEKTVSDFFSFCGEIKSLVLRRAQEEGGTQEAIVAFESTAAAKTAQLLTNALIVDRAITVRVYRPDDTLPTDAAAMRKKEDISQRSFDAPDSQRSKTSVIASMVASGWVLGEDVRRAAVDYDEKHRISAQIKERAVSIDAQLGLTQKMTQATTYVSGKLQQVDAQLGLSQAMHVAADKVSETAVAAKTEAERLAARAAENPLVGNVFQAFRSVGATIGSTFETIRQESIAAIDAKHAERAGSDQQGVTPVSEQQAPTEAPAAPAEAPEAPATLYPTIEQQEEKPAEEK